MSLASTPESLAEQSFLKPAERIESKFFNPVPTVVGGWSTMRKALPEYLRNKEERFPKTPLGPFRTDASIYEQPPASGLRITWMGHSSLLIEIDGFRILTDPVWDQRASPFRWAGPKRFFEAPLRLDQLPRLDAVLVSHDHYDHLGESTVRQLAKLPALSQTEWITTLGVGEILEQYGVPRRRIVQLDWTGSYMLCNGQGQELKLTAVPTRHFSGRSLFNRFETLWAAFVLQGGKHKIYFGADSGWWPGFTQIGRAYGPFDLTMLEIGAFNEMWHQIHMGPDGAARSFQDLGGSGLLMPIHWGLFDLALHAWRQPIQRMMEVAEEQRITLWSPEPGQPTETVAGQSVVSDWWRP